MAVEALAGRVVMVRAGVGEEAAVMVMIGGG